MLIRFFCQELCTYAELTNVAFCDPGASDLASLNVQEVEEVPASKEDDEDEEEVERHVLSKPLAVSLSGFVYQIGRAKLHFRGPSSKSQKVWCGPCFAEHLIHVFGLQLTCLCDVTR